MSPVSRPLPSVGGSNSGFRFLPGYFDRAAQLGLVGELKMAVADSPFFTPAMPRTGKPFSVRMTNLGPLGWVSDRERGYRYQATHPVTGRPWPPIPGMILDLWRSIAAYAHPPEACLVNYYAPTARMGLHQDSDEEDFSAPVVSISLGDSARFMFGGLRRKDPVEARLLESGDAFVFGGASRLRYHGVTRIVPGTAPGHLRFEGRLNLTFRQY